MEWFVFSSAEALEVALKAGLVPQAVQRGPALAHRTTAGGVAVATRLPFPVQDRLVLRHAGVSSLEPGEPPPPAVPVSCWAEALPPRPAPPSRGPLGTTVFAVEAGQGVVPLAGELLRLGCDRQELRLFSEGPFAALLRVVEPPYFAVARAIEESGGVRLFVPTPRGQEHIFTELGYRHPLEDSLQAPEGILFIGSEGPWWQAPPGDFLELDSLVSTPELPATRQLAASPTPQRVPVKLTLARALRREPPTLFIVPEGLPALESLVRSTPEARLDDILFAVAGGLVALLVRPGREAHAEGLPGAPHARVLELPNLFAPAGTTVDPPLRRDRLRAWLAPEAEEVVWLESTPQGLRRVALPESAFRPLSSWVDYVVDQSAEALKAWAQSSVFDWEAEVTEPPPSPWPGGEDAPAAAAASPGEEGAPGDAPERQAGGPRTPGRGSEARPGVRGSVDPRTPARGSPVRNPESRAPEVRIATAPVSELDAQVQRAEASFLELSVPPDAPERRQAWALLAELYARQQRPREAGMSWANALWEAPPEEAPALARRWAESAGGRLEALVQLEAPTPEHTRAVVAHLTREASTAGAPSAEALAAAGAFLDRFGDDLDVRSFWLARFSLWRLWGRDTLGLARARDRVLARLQRGLSLDRDVPRLMRVMGQATPGGAGTERASRVAAQLEGLLRAMDETNRKRSTIEAPPHLTRAYVHLEFAWGFARLGLGELTRTLRAGAVAALDASDPIHGYFLEAYGARLDQALEGIAPDTPLPVELSARLTALEPMDRFKVDRLRQVSLVLEPQERLDPFANYQRPDPRGEALRGIRDPAALLEAIEAQASSAVDVKLAPEERQRVLDGLLDFLPQLPESRAVPLLQRLVSLSDPLPASLRVEVLEDALKVAGHFGRGGLVRQLVTSLGSLFSDLHPEDMKKLGDTLVAGLRSLRRVGLRQEAADLLARAATLMKGDDVTMLAGRLSLAGGFGYLGQVGAAQAIIDEALARVTRGESTLRPIDRTLLNRLTARALSSTPTEVALPGLLRLAQQLPWLTDSLSNNSHFCLTIVDFADALVVGHVGDDLTLNEATRHFLEEDEHLVRRRVHRDVGEAGVV